MSTLELDSSPGEGRSLEEAILGFEADANASFIIWYKANTG